MESVDPVRAPSPFSPSLRGALLMLLGALALTSCYVPTYFEADIRLDRNGFYHFAFDGDLAWGPLYDALRRGSLTPEGERERARQIEVDLRRDGATKRATYARRGIFTMAWEKSGDLLATGMVTFLRRNERILSLTYSQANGTIVIEGTALSEAQATRLSRMGLTVSGVLRVRTDAPVISHNATSVEHVNPFTRIYEWRVHSAYDPTPRLTLAMH